MNAQCTRLARRVALPSAIAASFCAAVVIAQPAPHNGPRQVDPRWHALVHADVVPRPGELIENATVVIRNGVITSVESGGAPPEGARVWDLSGRIIYAGFVDPHVPVDAPAPDKDRPGAHWNEKVTPQRSALDGEGLDAKTREELRKMGFAAAAISPKGGVFRGSAAVVSLGDDADLSAAEAATVLLPLSYHEVAFETAGWGSASYPGSQMGAIALIRQTLLDADWHADMNDAYKRAPESHEPPAPSDALDAIGRNLRDQPPLLFDADDELEALRAAKIAEEFNRFHIILGSGTEFRRLDAIAANRSPVIVPLDYPEAPKVDTRAAFESTSLSELMTWEQAPTNARRLHEAGLLVALTTDRLKKRSDFHPNLRKAIEHGLDEDAALAMLTTAPAYILGVGERLGEVHPGMIANLVVTDRNVFDEKATILDVWVGGRRYQINEPKPMHLAGKWDFTFGGDPSHDGVLHIDVDDKGKVSVELAKAEGDDAAEDEKPVKARNVKVVENRLSYLVDSPEGDGVILASAVIEGDSLLGTIV
ncbi:MAG: amidohydrolase family protein, partial [Planctomycetota bacterium]|nr:amidohydrolase family protein [Planctomycetota bacterium]